MIDKSIAIITEDFPPASGGIAQWALGMARELVTQFDQVFVYSRRRAVLNSTMHNHSKFKLFIMHGHNWKQYRRLYTRYYAWKFLRKHQNSVVITTTWNLATGILKLKKKHRFTLIPILHGLEIANKSSPKMLFWMEKTLTLSDFSIAVSHFTKSKVLERIHIDKNRIKILPNGVDVQRFYPIENMSNYRRKWRIAPEIPVILTLARVVERKGHEAVIRALPEILEAIPNAIYFIAGPWRQWVYEELQQLIRNLNLENNVYFSGHIDDHEINSIYNMADVYIMVSKSLKDEEDIEGFGITFLEANACEKPVIGSYAGGIPEAVVHGETGFLVQPDNIDEIAARVIELLSHPRLRQQLGKAGRRRIKKELTWNQIAQNFIKLIGASAQSEKRNG